MRTHIQASHYRPHVHVGLQLLCKEMLLCGILHVIAIDLTGEHYTIMVHTRRDITTAILLLYTS